VRGEERVREREVEREEVEPDLSLCLRDATAAASGPIWSENRAWGWRSVDEYVKRRSCGVVFVILRLAVLVELRDL